MEIKKMILFILLGEISYLHPLNLSEAPAMLNRSRTDAPIELYQPTFRNILEEIGIDEPQDSSIPYYQCTGHTKFFHHFSSRKRAKRRAAEHIQKVFQPDKSIKHVHYNIINKKDPGGKETGYFNGLNFIYRYAITFFYQHHDNSLACPLHPFHNSHKPK